MSTFDAAGHANKIRGNDRGRFATQQRSESTEALLAGSRWDLSGHEEFLDEGRLAKLVHFNGVKPTDGPDGSPAVIIFHEDGRRIEKRYSDGVLHDGSGEHPSIARYTSEGVLYNLERGYRGARGFVEHTPSDGQPSRDHTWSNGVRDVHYCQHGRRVDPSPGVPGSERHTAEGISTYYHHDSSGGQHERNPGEPASFAYYPDGSPYAHSYRSHGKPVNGPLGVHEEVFHPDGSVKSIHEVYFNENESGYSAYTPNFRAAYYAPPRPADAEITRDKPLSHAEITDRMDSNGHFTVRVRIPLAKQLGASSLLAVASLKGFTELGSSKAPISRNRTIFDVQCDANALIETWAEGSFEDRYWAAKARARTQN